MAGGSEGNRVEFHKSMLYYITIQDDSVTVVLDLYIHFFNGLNGGWNELKIVKNVNHLF